MAKQLGPFKFEKTFGCFTFYRVGDKWYMRQKSSLSSRRVKTSKQFANTRASARRLATGTRIAAYVYRSLPEGWKLFELYQKLTGIATRLHKEGKEIEEIRALLEQQLYDWGYRKELQYPVIEPSNVKLRVRDFKPSLKFKVQSLRSGGVGCRFKVQGLRYPASKSKGKHVRNDNVRMGFAQRGKAGSKSKVQSLRCSASKFKSKSAEFSILREPFIRKESDSQRRIRRKVGYLFEGKISTNTS